MNKKGEVGVLQQKHPCLVVDVGNTSTGIGLYQGDTIQRSTHIPHGILHAPQECAAALRTAAGNDHIVGAVLGSVVPSVNTPWCKLIQRELGCDTLIVSAELNLDVIVDYPEPATIGADRLADACGGVRKYGAPLIITDFGTALTFDVVMPDNRYVGGVIAPGLPLMTDYLYERTALLPRVSLGGSCPEMGRTTQQAMRIGAQIGYRGMVREIVTYLGTTTGVNFKLVATGGYARWALEESKIDFTFDPTLTLYGLGCIFEKNNF